MKRSLVFFSLFSLSLVHSIISFLHHGAFVSGTVLSWREIEDIVRFAHNNKLALVVDEVRFGSFSLFRTASFVWFLLFIVFFVRKLNDIPFPQAASNHGAGRHMKGLGHRLFQIHLSAIQYKIAVVTEPFRERSLRNETEVFLFCLRLKVRFDITAITHSGPTFMTFFFPMDETRAGIGKVKYILSFFGCYKPWFFNCYKKSKCNFGWYFTYQPPLWVKRFQR